MRRVGGLLVAIAAGLLAGCAAPSATGPAPTGPYPSITAIVQIDSTGAQLQLLGVRVAPSQLTQAALPLAREVFGAASVRDAVPTPPITDTESDPAFVSTSVQVPMTEEATRLSLNEGAIEAVVHSMKPRSLTVWICSRDDRSIQVVTQAPGAVSSDATSGVCQVAGTSIAGDGVVWTATVDVTSVSHGSILKSLAIALIVALVAAGTWWWVASLRREEAAG